MSFLGSSSSVTTTATLMVEDLQPSIQVTHPTPPRPLTQFVTASSSPLVSSSPKPPPAHRLLYRGALSLPDSQLPLDGLTFSGPAGASLLENPLALALESMRGRPTLRFLGLRKLNGAEAGEGGWVDFTGGVCLDIHPQAILSNVYFSNIFCLSPNMSLDGKSAMGIRVALGDGSSGPETTEILIYAQILKSASTPRPLQLYVARLTLTPPPTLPQTTHLRLPRPDDPTPRKIPLNFASSSKRVISDSNTNTSDSAKRRKIEPLSTANTTILKQPTRKKKPSIGGDDPDIRRAREVMLYGAAILGASGPGRSRSASIGLDDGVFKVPVVPVRASSLKAQGKQRAVSEDVFKDIFGSTVHATGTGKPRGKINNARGGTADIEDNSELSDVEKANRAKIKKQTVKLITAPPIAISKTNPEFKDLFGYIYRGVAFAVRHGIRTGPLDKHTIDAFIESHMRLYVPGYDPGERKTVLESPVVSMITCIAELQQVEHN